MADKTLVHLSQVRWERGGLVVSYLATCMIISLVLPIARVSHALE